MAESIEAATTMFSRFGRDDVTACLSEVYNDRLPKLLEESEDPGDGELGDITVRALDVAPAGDEILAFRMEIPLSRGPSTFTAIADLVVVRVGRSLAGLVFGSVDGAPPTERVEEYTALAASRLPG